MRRWPLSHRPSESLTHCAPPGEGRAQAADPKTLPPFRKVTNAGSSGRWSGPGHGPLVVSFGGFRFLEPLAPSKQQQHGSQRLSTRPQSAGCTFPRTLRGRSGEFSWSCTDTLEALIVVYDGFNYHSQAWSWG